MSHEAVRRLARFGVSGSVVAVVNAIVMVGLLVVGVPAQVALATSYVCAVCLHFALNRQYVFTSYAGYSLQLTSQGVRYLAIAVCSYLLTSFAVAVLPGMLAAPMLAVYFATSISLALVSFVLLRAWVFRDRALQLPESRGG